jgi:hypothetical protein
VDLTIDSSSDLDFGDVVHRSQEKTPSTDEHKESKSVPTFPTPHCIDLNANDSFDDEDDVTLCAGLEREEELMAVLWLMVQSPSEGPIQRKNLEWTPVLFQRRGTYKVHEVAVIHWSHLEDFRVGESNNPTYPYKFLKDVRRVRPVGSLAIPRANNASRVKRYVYYMFSIE